MVFIRPIYTKEILLLIGESLLDFSPHLAVVGGHVVWSAVMIDPSDGIQIV